MAQWFEWFFHVAHKTCVIYRLFAFNAENRINWIQTRQLINIGEKVFSKKVWDCFNFTIVVHHEQI